MSPIIDQQRRLVEAGRIRAGDKDASGRPRKGKFWRLTSKDRRRLEAAALLWGGTVQEWDEQFELQTETAELPIMLLPDTEPSLWYELWTKGGCQRRCDGVTEVLSDSPCLCGDERQCKPHLRFPVLLPDIPGIGSWLVQSTGWYASNEIPGAIALLTKAAAEGVLMPARLRLEQCVEVKGGQTKRFVKPVIDIDVSFRELVGQTAIGPAPPNGGNLPGGYKPIAIGQAPVPTLEDGLAEAETQTVTRTSRSAAPFPEDDFSEFGPAPSGPDEPGVPPPPPDAPPAVPQAPPTTGNTVASSTRGKPATGPQKEKLNIIIARLTESGVLLKEHLYFKLAAMREGIDIHTEEGRAAARISAANWMSVLGATDEEGVVHWSPMREILNRGEANSLIDALEQLELDFERRRIPA